MWLHYTTRKLKRTDHVLTAFEFNRYSLFLNSVDDKIWFNRDVILSFNEHMNYAWFSVDPSAICPQLIPQADAKPVEHVVAAAMPGPESESPLHADFQILTCFVKFHVVHAIQAEQGFSRST